MKILHLPTAVGNHGYSLACAERRKGHDSKSLIFGENSLKMKGDWFVTYNSKVERLVKSLLLLGKIRKDFDVYHFNFCRTLIDYPRKNLHFFDLPLYKGRRFATFNGDDIRQSIDRSYNPYTPYPSSQFTKQSDNLKKIRVNKFIEEIDYSFVLNPDLMNFIPPNKGVFLPYIKESWFDFPGKKIIRNNKSFTIAHAPTDRNIKGTEVIIQAINKLKIDYDINFVLVEGVSHERAKKLYSECDLMIDQLRIGWYGGVAVEAMRMGVPVAVYINPQDLKYIPKEMKLAIDDSFLIVNEDNLYEKIACLIDSPMRYIELLDNSLEYINDFHNPDKVILQVIDTYERFLN